MDGEYDTAAGKPPKLRRKSSTRDWVLLGIAVGAILGPCTGILIARALGWLG